jgi:hypothetical protein
MSKNFYYSCIDPIPLQDEKFNKLYKFYEHLREGRLTTTYCELCEKYLWPPRTVCPNCQKGSSLKWVDLPKKGRLVTYSIQVNGVPPGYDNPLVLGIIEFENGVRIITSLEIDDAEKMREGDYVELVVKKVDEIRVMPSFKVI